MSYNPKSLFNKIQQKEQANSTGSTASGFSNPLLFKPKVGTSYSVRLLWLTPEEGFDREYPMINSYIHRVWDDNATSGNKESKVICPTSQYMMGDTSAAFKRCPICEASSEFYKKGQEGSESGKELYSKFRRTCIGYVPVYIVNGPEEDIHQIKILQYGKQFKDFFDKKIFGIQPKQRNAEETSLAMEEDALGVDAFMYFDEDNNEVVTSGYNLIITTTSKKMILNGKQVDMPQYSLDFSRKMSTITELDGIDLDSKQGIKYFNSLNAQVLHYDRDFYLKSTDEELHNFKLNFITKENVNESVESEETSIPRRAPIKPVKPAKAYEETEVETEVELDEIPMGNAPKKPVVEIDTEEDLMPVKQSKARKVEIEDDDALIDDLLADIK